MAKENSAAMKSGSRTARRGVIMLIIVAIVAFGACVIRIAYLTLIKGEEYREKAEAQQLSVTTVDAARGTIYDRNMNVLEQELAVSAMLRGQELRLSGDPENVPLAEQVISQLMSLLQKGETIEPLRIRYAIQMAREGNLGQLDQLSDGDVVAFTYRGRPIRGKTIGQRAYVNAVRSHELTLAVGPAGTGKTYLAMAMAVVALKNKEVERIVLTRPAVEAGERLGFSSISHFSSEFRHIVGSSPSEYAKLHRVS
jgi:phosphate starvation-inducible protein PhoH